MDESSGYKVYTYKPKRILIPPPPLDPDDEPMPPSDEKSCDCKKEKQQTCRDCKKENKQTKSLYVSQQSVIGLQATFPSGETEDLYMNENANSVYGHQPSRHWSQSFTSFDDRSLSRNK